jgi:hypothetical protein
MVVRTVAKGHSVMCIYMYWHEEASGKQTDSVEKCRFSPPRTRTLLPTPTERQSWAPQLTKERKASKSANQGSVHDTEEAQVSTRRRHEPRRFPELKTQRSRGLERGREVLKTTKSELWCPHDCSEEGKKKKKRPQRVDGVT